MSFISKTAKRKSATPQSHTQVATEEMSKCPKCGEPVYFAERKTILGKDWHSRCLVCDNCDRQLTPGQHSAHCNKPYCNACYQALFGPEGYRQGTVEPRRVAIKGAPPARRDTLSKSDIKTKIKEYNLYKNSPVEKLKSRETNGQILFEGVLKLYWGLKRPIVLSPGVMYNKRHSSIRGSIVDFVNVDDDAYKIMLAEAEKEKKKRELGSERPGKKLHEIISSGWDSQERMPKSPPGDEEDLTVSLPVGGYNSLPSTPEHRGGQYLRTGSVDSGSAEDTDGNSMSTRSLTRGTSVEPGAYNSRSPIRKRSASFRKISKHKRLEGKTNSEMHHQFTPPYGSPTSVRVTSTIPTKDVILMLIAKYKVENPVDKFNLCVIYDSGVQEFLSDEDYPLQKRLKLGPNEDIAKIYIVEAHTAKEEHLTEEIAAWIKFSLTELQQFDKKFEEEREREEQKIRSKFLTLKGALQEQLQNDSTGPRHETEI